MCKYKKNIVIKHAIQTLFYPKKKYVSLVLNFA